MLGLSASAAAFASARRFEADTASACAARAQIRRAHTDDDHRLDQLSVLGEDDELHRDIKAQAHNPVGAFILAHDRSVPGREPPLGAESLKTTVSPDGGEDQAKAMGEYGVRSRCLVASHLGLRLRLSETVLTPTS